ncbi:MAG: peptidoglycan-binding protein [Candidatus Omnitrophica bacterium]|nr:peptidoglycan-binding protein [Candidatus Omnitrophota bacterium]
MKRFIVFGCIFFMMLTLCVAGCAKNKKKAKETETQQAALSSELERIEAELASTRELLKQSEGERLRMQEEIDALKSGGVATTAGAEMTEGMYRTPSGFTIPAKDLQVALKNAGYYTGPIDGVVGKGTKQAIQDFQRDNGLEADGVCGRQTWTKLSQYLKNVK